MSSDHALALRVVQEALAPERALAIAHRREGLDSVDERR